MKRFLDINYDALQGYLGTLRRDDLMRFFKFIADLFDENEFKKLDETLTNSKKRNIAKTATLVAAIAPIFQDQRFKERIHNKLVSTEESKFLYEQLVWHTEKIDVDKLPAGIRVELIFQKQQYGDVSEALKPDVLSLINHSVTFKNGVIAMDCLTINHSIKQLLMFVLKAPDELFLEKAQQVNPTEFEYSNEDEILNFISIIGEMAENNLVEIGNAEKPLVKTLNIIKTSASAKEFYEAKGSDLLANDMLVRSFYFFYHYLGGYKGGEINVLKEFVIRQLDDEFNFFISRIFVSHLKKVRFDPYYASQKSLFNVVKAVLFDMSQDGFASVQDILKFCKKRGLLFYIEDSYKTSDYYMSCDVSKSGANLFGDKQPYITHDVWAYKENYYTLFFEPTLKAAFFYLGALGILELRYNTPTSKHNIKAEGKPYISVWDGLEYIRFTDLGKFVLGLSAEYTPKEIQQNKTKLKFDEYSPIITVDAKDGVTIAKLESYADKIDANKYILSYGKIFKDCNNNKALTLKIDGFYKQISDNPPKLFFDFFDKIKQRANLLERENKLISIKLKNDKELLELFMTNKKIQEITVKAQGLRVLILKDDIVKLKKICLENGFFVEF